MTDDDSIAAEARAYLEGGGCKAIRITGGGESWMVSVGWHPEQFFVVAYSEKNPNTPTDPLFLAQEALAALIRNEGPCPHAFHVESAPMEAPETDALWSPEEEAPDLGAELLEVQDEEGQDSGDDTEWIEPAADPGAADVPALDDEHSAVPVQDGLVAGLAGDEQPTGPSYPGIAITREYDDFGEFKNAILASITARKVLLLDVAADPSRRSFLVEAFSEYQNTGALGLPISDQLAASYRDYMALQARDAQIASHAQQLERLALSADWEALNLIRDHFEAGWP